MMRGTLGDGEREMLGYLGMGCGEGQGGMWGTPVRWDMGILDDEKGGRQGIPRNREGGI